MTGVQTCALPIFTGVFAVYVWSTDAGVGPKYLVLYPRQNTELVKIGRASCRERVLCVV